LSAGAAAIGGEGRIMALTFPRTDILTAVAFADQGFDLMSLQELSRQANNITRGKDFGSALWMATYTTDKLLNDDAVAYEALLNSLDGVINPFMAGDLRRLYPRLHADGAFADTGVIDTIDDNNKALRIGSLPAGLQLSVGDYLAFGYGSDPTSRALHQVMEAATADAEGLTPLFEVRPHIREGWVNDPPIAVALKQPRAEFVLMPGSIDKRMQGGRYSVITFKAVQSL
jgi:hypothetical protein